MKEIKLSELNKLNCATQSVKDKSPRGYVTKETEEVKAGDFVLVNNRFVLVVEDKINAGNKPEEDKMKELIYNEAVKKNTEWAENENLIRRFSTDYMYNKYKAGETTHENAYKKAYTKMAKTMYKERDKKLEKLAKIEQAEDIEQIRISVEWKKSTTWGNNPHVELSAYSSYSCCAAKATASGCGYDKESQAIAEALNSIDGVRKLLIEKLDYINEKKPYGINQYNTIPAFSGGVGTNCFTSFFKNIGWKVTEMHGKTYDSYVIEK